MINERLKILLKELGLSQRQFAMKINLDAGYFSRIIRGKVNPPDRILLLIENVFNVNKDWLENGEGEIFSGKDISLAKKQILESIEMLSDEQIHAVSSFLKYLTENKKKGE
jgi:DNA-binding helix-turn-helix protein